MPRQDRIEIGPWSKTDVRSINQSSNQGVFHSFKKRPPTDVPKRNLTNTNYIAPNFRRCSIGRASNLAGLNLFPKSRWTCRASERLKSTDFYKMAFSGSFSLTFFGHLFLNSFYRSAVLDFFFVVYPSQKSSCHEYLLLRLKMNFKGILIFE